LPSGGPGRTGPPTLAPTPTLINVIKISHAALRDGCERAHDIFMLNRLRTHDEAAAGFEAVYEALGIDSDMRERLQSAVARLVPVDGLPAVEATAVASMVAGVLVGLLIADSALPVEELDLPVAPVE
jgi:hypothetical protein